MDGHDFNLSNGRLGSIWAQHQNERLNRPLYNPCIAVRTGCTTGFPNLSSNSRRNCICRHFKKKRTRREEKENEKAVQLGSRKCIKAKKTRVAMDGCFSGYCLDIHGFGVLNKMEFLLFSTVSSTFYTPYTSAKTCGTPTNKGKS